MKLITCFFIFSLFIFQSAIAQCCGAGNPVVGDAEQRNAEKNMLKAFLIHKYSYSDTYFDGSEKLNIDKPIGMLKLSDYNYSEINFIYGVTEKLSVQTALGYFWNKSMDYQNNTLGRLSGSGFGDWTLNAKYRVYKNFFHKFEITPGIGIKLPIGVFDQYQNNVLLPITIQPSSGSYKYLGNITLYKGFRSSDFSILSYNSVELSSKINSPSFTHFMAGNLYVNALYFMQHMKKISLVLQVRNEYREMEIRNGNLKKDTGGNILYLSPAVGVKVFKSGGLTLGIDYPVFRYYNAIQLGNNFALTVRYSQDFKLGSNSTD